VSYFILPDEQKTEGTIMIGWEGTFTNWSNDTIRGNYAAVIQVINDDATVVAQGSQALSQVPAGGSTNISVSTRVETEYVPVTGTVEPGFMRFHPLHAVLVVRGEVVESQNIMTFVETNTTVSDIYGSGSGDLGTTPVGPTFIEDPWSWGLPLTKPQYPRLDSSLNKLVGQIGSQSAADIASSAPVFIGDLVAVTVRLSHSVASTIALLESAGATIANTGTDYIEAYVPVTVLVSLSESDGVLSVKAIMPPTTSNAVPSKPGDTGPIYSPYAPPDIWDIGGPAPSPVQGTGQIGDIGSRGSFAKFRPRSVIRRRS